jgi:hypothetical protein
MQTETLITGLSDAMVQSRINKIDVKPFYYNTLFPVRKINFFQWKTLTNQLGAKNVAADLAADNASVIRKRRPIFQVASGDIPLFTISRDLKRSEIKEYQIAAELAKGTPEAKELVDYWGNDVDFCFNGVQSKLEYVALALASNAGVIAFTNTNNAAVATENNLDYDVDPLQKETVSVSFANPATADFIGTVAKAVKTGKDKFNSNIKYAYISLEEFYRIAVMDQVIKGCASFANLALDNMATPDLATINSMLARTAWTNGVKLIVVDQTITHELADGSQVSGNPFIDHRMVFSESPILGSTQYSTLLNDNDKVSLRATRGHTTVKKYGQTEPYSEVTLAEADALPVFDTAYKNIYVKTDATSW